MALTTIGLMALLGCFTGFMAGLLGIGGGVVISPVLVFEIPSSLIPHDHIVHVAIATSLATIAFTRFLPSELTINAAPFVECRGLCRPRYFGRCGRRCTDRRLAADILAVLDFRRFRRVLRVQDVPE